MSYIEIDKVNAKWWVEYWKRFEEVIDEGK